MSDVTVKYVNKNLFPIYLPCPKGGQVMFRPGEGTAQQWYSRMCGPKQLTRVGPPPVVAPAKPATVIPLGRPVAPIQLTRAQPKISGVTIVQETDQWSCARGIYKCKACEIFMTGSIESMKAHITGYHAQPIKPPAPIVTPKPAPKVVAEPKLGEGEFEGEKVAVSSMKSVSATVSHKDEEEATITRTASGKPVAKAPAPVAEPVVAKSVDAVMAEAKRAREDSGTIHACEFPGCGKQFISNRGLHMHKVKVHGQAKDKG